MQYLMHQFKYKGDKDLGKQLGYLMGNDLSQADRFNQIDALIPLPLFAAKEKRRGYNQALVLCEGMSEIMKVEILSDVVIRTHYTETQTKKGRIERGKILKANLS
jgi:Predicted amidophosphoribosyltransferases